MISYKVQILPKTKDFEKELIDFLFDKSTTLKRDSLINNLLNNSANSLNLSELFKSYDEISLDEVYGSTFQTYWRNNKDIYAISHTIRKIFMHDEKIYATLEPNSYGEIINFEKGVLRPVYYKPIENIDEYKIATFDIDFNISIT